jgi:hypothetical protein
MVKKSGIAIVLGIFAVACSPAHAAVDPAVACMQKKAKATGKKAADLLKAFGKNVKQANPAKLAADISKAQSKFTKGFTKAESKDSCWTSGDSGTIEAKVDALVIDVIDDVTTPACELTYPQCNGPCPPGLDCIDTGSACECLPSGPPPCNVSGPPQCDGTCNPGEMCVENFGICECVPAAGPCGAVQGPPLCAGECAPNEACVDLGGFCQCVF